MEANLQKAIVRICDDNNNVIGLGFLVSPELVLTCAHLLLNTVGSSTDISEITSKTVLIDFPFIEENKIVSAQIVFWNMENDIAGLKLQSLPPMGVQHAPVVVSENLQGHPFRAFGVPKGFDSGVWSAGVLHSPVVNDWIQIEEPNLIGHKIQRGFSGSPVWDERLGGVVGIISATDSDPDKKTSYMIPSNLLIKSWSELSSISSEKKEKVKPKTRKLKVFLCHATEDKNNVTAVRENCFVNNLTN